MAEIGDSKVISYVAFTVAVVLGLDQLDVVIFFAFQLGQWHPLWIGGDHVLRNSTSVIKGLTLSSHGWLHGLVDGVVCTIFGQLVVAALDQVLSLCVQLKLGNVGFDQIGLIIGSGFVKSNATDSTVLKQNLKRLAADWHWLVFDLITVDLSFPSVGHGLVDLSIFGVLDLAYQSVTIAGTDDESGTGKDTSPLILQVRQSSQSATTHLIAVFSVLIPCSIPHTAFLVWIRIG